MADEPHSAHDRESFDVVDPADRAAGLAAARERSLIASAPWRDRLAEALEDRGLSAGRLAGGAAVALALLVVGWWLLRPPPAPVESTLAVETTSDAASSSGPPGATPSSGAADATTTTPRAVVAHAAGAVAQPGLYRLRPGARVADLLAAAGGLSAGADGDRINLAAPVADGERVYVLRVGEAAVPEAVEGDGGGAAAVGGPAGPGTTVPAVVDVNTATAAELDALPGVGPSTAAAIVAYRQQHGRFASVDDLLDVRGIGDAKLAEMRAQVRV